MLKRKPLSKLSAFCSLINICVNDLYLSAPVGQLGGDGASLLGSEEASSPPYEQPDQTGRNPPLPLFGRETDTVWPKNRIISR